MEGHFGARGDNPSRRFHVDVPRRVEGLARFLRLLRRHLILEVQIDVALYDSCSRATLLHHMRQFVREQALAVLRFRRVIPSAEYDVAADRECARTD